MLKKVSVPDIGAYKDVDVIEVLVSLGDHIDKETSLITLETEKATLEVPSPYKGVIKSIDVKVGDKVSEGSQILTLEVVSDELEKQEEAKETESKEAKKEVKQEAEQKTPMTQEEEKTLKKPEIPKPIQEIQTELSSLLKEVHAGPKVRRFARELGVDLTRVVGTGRKGRILQLDVQAYVKQEMTKSQAPSQSIAGLTLPPWPVVDYAKVGPVTISPLSRIKKISGSYLHRNWVMVPHITQFDEADITELETFRKEQQKLAEEQGVKLTPLVFIMKAVVAALKNFPNFNASLDISTNELIIKHYFHIGVAVDTPNGLVVPVVRDVDQKGLFQLAKELGEISQKARKGQLTAQEMQGSSFSISSLGGIGGTAFTPIINVPDVAILGVSKAAMKPIFIEGEFKPRFMLPLSLSYDHRVIDGAEGARFTSYLVKKLSDIRLLLL